jgi:predicted cupin superfamily sugar epimerase
MQSAKYWIEKLKLKKHPEGGWYREIYRSDDVVPQTCLPAGFGGERSFSTSIFYLLEGNDYSAFHRIRSDEIWHFYEGTSAIEIVFIEKKLIKTKLLGNDPENGQHLQVVIPKNTWFAAKLLNPAGFALTGCTVSPGFHFSDLELAGEGLVKEFPENKAEIISLLRKITT